MIPTKIRESRRGKVFKVSKNLERLYKEGKCRECAVVVTRMDFAKILGKFTKVKIQYESSSTPKGKRNNETTSSNTNARLKKNENGIVHKNSYFEHPVRALSSKKTNQFEYPSRHIPNILKENNRMKKPAGNQMKDKNSNYDNLTRTPSVKKYGIVFEDPMNTTNTDIISKTTLTELLSHIDDSILPSYEWCIDYFPKKSEEPKDDKVYDRIAAELEDLMYNEKPIMKSDEKSDGTEGKVDEFPSIMDILNENTSESKANNQNTAVDFKPNIESTDVEAMLLGKTNLPSEPAPPTAMEVDNTDVGNLIEDVVSQLDNIESTVNNQAEKPSAPSDEVENPNSPSILDEALQKGIEEHLPESQPNTDPKIDENPEVSDKSTVTKQTENPPVVESVGVQESGEVKINLKEKIKLASISGITHVIFKKSKDGTCFKSVTCPRNLKYSIELEGKPVELLGAPKYISNLEDLRVLLQIVNESEINSLYILN